MKRPRSARKPFSAAAAASPELEELLQGVRHQLVGGVGLQRAGVAAKKRVGRVGVRHARCARTVQLAGRARSVVGITAEGAVRRKRAGLPGLTQLAARPHSIVLAKARAGTAVGSMAARTATCGAAGRARAGRRCSCAAPERWCRRVGHRAARAALAELGLSAVGLSCSLQVLAVAAIMLCCIGSECEGVFRVAGNLSESGERTRCWKLKTPNAAMPCGR